MFDEAPTRQNGTIRLIDSTSSLEVNFFKYYSYRKSD